jgi:hypothetical protein
MWFTLRGRLSEDLKQMSSSVFVRGALGAIAIALLAGGPLRAGQTLTFTAFGTFTPLQSGTDPLHFLNQSFTLTGTIDSTASPTGSCGTNCVTYVPTSVEAVVGTLSATGTNLSLNITVPTSGFDILDLSATFLAVATTTSILNLPAGTLSSGALLHPEAFASTAVGAGSSFQYNFLTTTTNLGISSGSASGIIIPEPGSVTLMGAGLAALAVYFRKRKTA